MFILRLAKPYKVELQNEVKTLWDQQSEANVKWRNFFDENMMRIDEKHHMLMREFEDIELQCTPNSEDQEGMKILDKIRSNFVALRVS